MYVKTRKNIQFNHLMFYRLSSLTRDAYDLLTTLQMVVFKSYFSNFKKNYREVINRAIKSQFKRY